ncbi:MAG: ABC transporter, partial [Actinobacteria bacterium]|nr:ABC transporter [Actinomycetota bacterium]
MEVIQFTLLGLATGAIYALVALGLVLIYRGSGLLNFAQGAVAMFGAYAYYEIAVRLHAGRLLALAGALALSALLGAAIHLVVLREMRRRNASPLARVIATLSVLLILQSAAFLIYGVYPLHVPGLLPTSPVSLFGGQVTLTADRLWIIGICLVLSGALYVVYRRTSFGRVTTAVAENELAASSLGHSPDAVAAINWAVGSVLAGLAGILIAPILLLQPTTLVLLIIPALAAGLLGGFVSFPVVLVAALGLGIAQSEITRYVHGVGWSTAVPFLVAIAYLVVRGRALPLRSFVLDRPPRVGSGRLRPPVLAALFATGTVVAFGAGAQWDTAMITSFGFGIIGLSIVLLTGYGGQLSLAQYVIAGVGAMVAAKLAAHMVLVPAVVIAVLATGAAGALIGLPALRTRGATLAVATLCLGSAVIAVVFFNSAWTGGLNGLAVPSLSLLGWSVDPVTHPDRYAFVTFSAMMLLAIAVA